jgi:hypothetical protein
VTSLTSRRHCLHPERDHIGAHLRCCRCFERIEGDDTGEDEVHASSCNPIEYPGIDVPIPLGRPLP